MYPNCNLVESDLLFDTRVLWGGGSLSDDRFDRINFTLTASHELGHGLGLNHSNGFLSRMNALYPFGGGVGNDQLETPLTDDIRAVRFLYPSTTQSENDLVASRYKNFYGTQARFNGVKKATDNQQTTILERNEAYFVDYTIENHGNTSQNGIRLGFYLSNDSEISSSDFLLGTMYLDMAYGSTQSSTVWLQIPNNSPTGSQFIGYLIDDQNTVTESDEINNGVAVPSTNINGSFTVIQ